jgi:predicted CoA-substrate-specific enzyme activase
VIVAGVDIGSLTAKVVLLKNDEVIASGIRKISGKAVEVAASLANDTLKSVGMKVEDLAACCTTGYGRFEVPFSTMNATEIKCHGAGAFFLDDSIRTIIDIGGQDCKAVNLNDNGAIVNFKMNDKCAAGTGRNLEILSNAIGVAPEDLGHLGVNAKKQHAITNRCSVFMELDVLDRIYRKDDKKNVAWSINDAVARRVAALLSSVELSGGICITGGVSKNVCVTNRVSEILGVQLKVFSFDGQLVGALGAAVLAGKSMVDK